MKKWFTLLLTVVLMLSLAAPAFAGVTGEWTDKTLEIAGLPADKAAEQTKMEKGVNNVVDFSEFGTTDPGTKGHRITYEYNQDLLDTVLLKQDNDRNPNLTEYITYKMDKNIAGFEFDVLCCAGLGDPLEDLSVFISKTGAANSWVQIKTQATYYEFDPNYYIVWDKAYWFHSTLTNAQTIPSGYKYIKIQFNPCNNQGDVTWNVALDDVKVIFGTNVAPVTIPEDKKFVDWETINAEREATKTTNGTTTTAGKPVNGTTTAKPVNGTTVAGTTTATNEQGENVTDPSTAPTNEQGGNTPDNNDGNNDAGNTVGGTPTQNTGNDAQHEGGHSGLIWIIVGIVVVIGAGAAVFFIMKKKN